MNVKLRSGGIRTQGFLKKSKHSKPLISIITVSYNAGGTIARALESVQSQTYDNMEHVIIDGGSTDNTLEIIHQYENVIDYWVSEPDKGIYDAMNKGIQSSRGDWLLFLGADDVLLDSVHEFVSAITDSTAVYYGNVLHLSNNQLYDGEFNILKLIRRNIPHQGTFFPKNIFNDNLYDPTFPLLADYAFNLRMYSKTKYVYLPIVFAKFNDKGISSQLVDYEFRGKLHRIIKDNYHFSVFLIFSLAWWATSFWRRK